MAIELVVFDMAGTTVHDSDGVSSCFREALATAGVTAGPAAVRAVMGLPKPEAIRLLGCGAENVEAVHRDFVERMRRYYATDPAVREEPGASAVFAELRRAGVKVALNTGFSRDIVEVILTRLGWAAAVDATVASDEVARGRPHPDMIRRLMGRLGVVDARRVAKVGDTVVDLEEGSAAGCGLVIGVTTGACTRPELLARPHTQVVDSLREAAELCRPHGAGRPAC